MNKSRLEMDFLDGQNKILRISLDSPKEDIATSEVEEAMENIILHNIFSSKTGDLVGVGAARIVSTSINELEF